MLKYLGRLGAAVAAAWLALAPASIVAAGPAWEQWQTVKGIFDVDGPRSDGSLLVAGSAALYLVDAGGNQMPFARGPGGYREDPGTEAYVAVSHGGKVGAAGCSFTPDETFILRLHVPMGITRVTASGEDSGSFANLTGDASQEYFSDGLTDEMITQLGRLNPARLRIAGRTSAMTWLHCNVVC